MVRKGAIVNRSNQQGEYPLHTAAARGKEKSVRLLLLNQALPDALNRYLLALPLSLLFLPLLILGTLSSHGETALHLATRGGYLPCIRQLMEVNADWSIVGPHGHCIQVAKAAKNSAVLPLYQGRWGWVWHVLGRGENLTGAGGK